MQTFTEKEKLVIGGLLAGKTTKQIAFEMGVTSRAVEFHLTKIYTKLGVSSRTEAVIELGRMIKDPIHIENSEDVRESEVEKSEETPYTGDKPFAERLLMYIKKPWLVLLAVIILLAAIYLFALGLNSRQVHPSEPTLQTPTSNGTESESSIQAPVLKYAGDSGQFTSPEGQPEISVPSFTIKEDKMHLELRICDFLLPLHFEPLQMVDPKRILVLGYGDSSLEIGDPIQVSDDSNTGHLEGSDENPCFVQVIDYSIPLNKFPFLIDEPFDVFIPVEDHLEDDQGKYYDGTAWTFEINLRVDNAPPLSQDIGKSDFISGRQVYLQYYDFGPEGTEIWVIYKDRIENQTPPSIALFYQGDMSAAVTEECDPYPRHTAYLAGGMCYSTFIQNKLTSTQHGTLPHPANVLVWEGESVPGEWFSASSLASIHSELEKEGIQFDYPQNTDPEEMASSLGKVSKPAAIKILKMPENLSEQDARQKVQDAIVNQFKDRQDLAVLTIPTNEDAADTSPHQTETPNQVTITGIVMDVALSARVITLTRPVSDITSIALTDATKILFKNGDEATLQEITDGMQIQATGEPGSPGSLIATQIVLLEQ
jgi:DNA-binding CsgD family transcriptional regulator